MKEPLTFIDLFAGAGGFSLGFHQAGMKGIFAIERDPMAFETLRYNLIDRRDAFAWPPWLPVAQMDIRYVINRYKEELRGLRGKVDLVAGGPPCQGFSTAGRRIEHDERNQMFREYINFVELVAPRMILFENVPGFSFHFRKNGTGSDSYSGLLKSELLDIGYEPPTQEIYDLSDFGVPQSRKRLIVFTSEKGSDPKSFQERVGGKRNSIRKVGVEKAISDLRRINGEIESPDSNRFRSGLYGKPSSAYQLEMRKGSNEIPDSHRFANHSGRIVERFSEIIKSSYWARDWTKDYMKSLKLRKRDLNALDPGIPSPTLTTLPDDYIHYEEPRILTVREYARLQAFPDWFEFKGKYTTGGKLRVVETPRYTQVANAVPPLVSNLAASTINSIF
jgi:DNA (cytosine-5)-methyltransferase 1